MPLLASWENMGCDMENGKEKQYMGMIPVAQYGSVLQMDGSAMQGEMDAVTGAIKNIKVNGKQQR